MTRRIELSRERWSHLGAILEATEGLDEEARRALIDRECGADDETRRLVEAVLLGEARVPAFLEGGAAALVSPIWTRVEAEATEELAPIAGYRLFEEIGRGGMSRVFAAERVDDSLHRRFAIKRFAGGGILRDDLRRRFVAEGRALAALSHPNIARIFDTGIDDNRLPYLVMERIDGSPITEHCAERALDLEPRIDLFLDVCSAVRHAHQRLIVHRDLKPSNILVDRDGTVKLLDFGIAKLLAPALDGIDEPAAATRTGLLPMTPEYAAPEQVRGEEITTATDVYALGLLLFELLTGRRAQAIEGRSAAELERVVCFVPARRPSSVIQIAEGASAPPARALRAIDRKAWRRLAGDLDTIVLKALRKEPEARYQSVDALVDDLRRRRAGLPVSARPASFAYRARKFVSRNRRASVVAAAASIAVVGFGVAALVQRGEALRQRDAARLESAKSEEVLTFLLGLFEASDPSRTLGEETTARELLERGASRVDRATLAPEVEARMLDVLGTVFGQVGNHSRAEELLRRSLSLVEARGSAAELEAARVLEHLAAVVRRRGDYADAERLYRRALEIRERRSGPDDPAVAATLGQLALTQKERGEPESAEPLLRRATGIFERRGGGFERESAEIGLSLGEVLHDVGRYDEAEAVLRRARESLRRLLGPVHPRIADADNALANLLARRGRFAEAEPLLREALAQRRKIFGEEHSDVAQSLNDLAVLLENRGDFETSAPVYAEALAAYERLFGPDHLAVAIAASNLANVHLLRGRPEEAELLFHRSLDVVERLLGADNRYAPLRRTGIGVALHARGELAAAEAEYRRALDLMIRHYGPDHAGVAVPGLELGRLLTEQGRTGEAEPLLSAAVEINGRTLGPRHPRTVRAQVWLGACYLRAGDAREGTRRVAEALAIQRELLPTGHPHLAESSWLLDPSSAGRAALDRSAPRSSPAQSNS